MGFLLRMSQLRFEFHCPPVVSVALTTEQCFMVGNIRKEHAFVHNGPSESPLSSNCLRLGGSRVPLSLSPLLFPLRSNRVDRKCTYVHKTAFWSTGYHIIWSI